MDTTSPSWYCVDSSYGSAQSSRGYSCVEFLEEVTSIAGASERVKFMETGLKPLLAITKDLDGISVGEYVGMMDSFWLLDVGVPTDSFVTLEDEVLLA